MARDAKKASAARRSILGGTSRATYVRATRNVEDWGGKMPEQWPRCRAHGRGLVPSVRWSDEDTQALCCPQGACSFIILVALGGLPGELAAAFRLGGAEGFADALGIDVLPEVLH